MNHFRSWFSVLIPQHRIDATHRQNATSKPVGARLVAHICFSGDCDGPNDPAAAAVALCRHGFEVSLLPEKYRPLLAVPGDDFLEASKNVSAAGDDDVQGLIDGMWAEVERLVIPFGGDVFECGEATPTTSRSPASTTAPGYEAAA